MTDNRSARDPAATASLFLLGEKQLAWFVDQLTTPDGYGLAVWVNSDPRSAPAHPGSDTWAGFAEERSPSLKGGPYSGRCCPVADSSAPCKSATTGNTSP